MFELRILENGTMHIGNIVVVGSIICIDLAVESYIRHKTNYHYKCEELKQEQNKEEEGQPTSEVSATNSNLNSDLSTVF